MVHPEKTRLFLVAALLALAGLTACESAAEREERLAREAYIESLDIEELKKDLETVNPDPYARDKTRTGNIGRSKRSEEHTSELQSLMRISYAVFCLKKKNKQKS